MTSLAATVIAFCRASAVFRPGERVVLAVSGGPDSVALAWLMTEAAASLEVDLAGIVHVHHGIRGAEADADLALVERLAAELGLPRHVERLDVPAMAARRGWSIEHAGHHARHGAYKRARRALTGTVTATGHTRGDLAETFLLRAMRGASRRGLAGMAPRRGDLARPLLDTTRDEVVAYLEARERAFRHDSTNDDESLARNRLRRVVMPVLGRAFPGAERALARSARLAADEELALETVATDWARRFVLTEDGVARIDRAAFAALPPALARRVVRSVVEALGGGGVSLARLDALAELGRRTRGCIQSGGFRVDIEGKEMRVSRPPARDPGP